MGRSSKKKQVEKIKNVKKPKNNCMRLSNMVYVLLISNITLSNRDDR